MDLFLSYRTFAFSDYMYPSQHAQGLFDYVMSYDSCKLPVTVVVKGGQHSVIIEGVKTAVNNTGKIPAVS